MTAVDHQQIRQHIKPGVTRLKPRKPSGQRLAHRDQVVAARFGMNTEPPVCFFIGLAVLKDDHGRDRIPPLQVRVIKALQPAGNALQAQNGAKLYERALSALPCPLLQCGVLFKRIDAVAIGQLRKLSLIAALRPVQMDPAPGAFGKPQRNGLHIRRIGMQQNFRGEGGDLQIILL